MKKLLLLLLTLASITFATPNCKTITRSSFINQVCYENQTKELWMLLKDQWYKYQGVPDYVYENLIIAPSMGQFFNYNIKDHYPFTKEAP